MNWKKAIELRVGDKKYSTLTRIKVGRVLAIIAALPLFTSWLFIIAIPLMAPLSFPVWTKMKVRDLKEWRSLR